MNAQDNSANKKAIVHVSGTNYPQWIYYKRAIQCFECGWWHSDVDFEEATLLFQKHKCEPEEESK